MGTNVDSRGWYLRLWIAIGGMFGATICLTLATAICAYAQITRDGTLPNNSSVSREGGTFNITGGTQAGRNLFHSFSEFSVPTGGTAFFNNAADIQNIFSRVTGGSASNIDGILKTNGTANLFLINPNGIIFGQGAKLNIGGSFLASTANAIGFGNQGFFSASNPESSSSLLTVNPSALLFNQIKTASIQNNSVAPSGLDPSSEFTATGLRVPDGKSLLLVGGNINMDGGGLYAFGGRVELGGLAAPGSVNILLDGNNFKLGFPENVARGNVSLTNQAFVYVEGADNGNIAVNARNLDILEKSGLSAGIAEGLGMPKTVADNISLQATGEIKINRSVISNIVRSDSEGDGGNIIIGADSFKLQDGAQLNTSTFGFGSGGNININTGELRLQDGAQLNTSTFGRGNAGNVVVQVLGSASFADASILSTVESRGVGSGGNIDITAERLSIIGANAGLFVNSTSSGNAGNIQIKSPNITLDKARLQANSASGNGGNIIINSNLVLLRRGVQISATAGTAQVGGNGGNIIINAFDGSIVAILKENNIIAANAFTGNGGNLIIMAQAIFGIEQSPQSTLSFDIPVNLNLHDASSQIVQACTLGSRQRASSFVVTGRGGLAPSPTEPLQDFGTPARWVQLEAKPSKPSSEQVQNQATQVSRTPQVSAAPIIVEASGWVTEKNGDIVLVATDKNVFSRSSWQTPTSCTRD